MTVRVVVPDFRGNRDHARELFLGVSGDLAGCVVVVDCSSLNVAAPTFVDELVKVVLVDCGAASLTMSEPTARATQVAVRSAARYGVSGRLTVTPRT